MATSLSIAVSNDLGATACLSRLVNLTVKKEFAAVRICSALLENYRTDAGPLGRMNLYWLLEDCLQTLRTHDRLPSLPLVYTGRDDFRRYLVPLVFDLVEKHVIPTLRACRERHELYEMFYAWVREYAEFSREERAGQRQGTWYT